MPPSRTDRISARLFAEAGVFIWQRRVEFLLAGWVWMGLLIFLYTAVGKALMPIMLQAMQADPANAEAAAQSAQMMSGFPVYLLMLIAISTALLAYNWHNVVIGRPVRITPVSGWSVEALRYAAKMLLACLVLPFAAFILLTIFILPLISQLSADTLSSFLLVLVTIFLFYVMARNLVLSAYVMSGQPNPITRSWKASGTVIAVPAGCLTLIVLVWVMLNSGTSIVVKLLALLWPDLAGLVMMTLSYVVQFVLLAWLVTLSQRVYDWMFAGRHARIDV